MGYELVIRYQKVKWNQTNPNYPVILYSEIGEDGYETRKVDLFGDGRLTFAGPSRSTGTTVLGEKPVPSLAEIAKQQEFDAEQITKGEFEEIWRLATGEA